MEVTLSPPPVRELLQSLNRLRDSSPAVFEDIALVCSDGVVHWNQFLLAANSPFLARCLGGAASEEEPILLLPSVSSSTLASMLKCTLNVAVRGDTLSVNEQQVMAIMGFERGRGGNQGEQQVEVRTCYPTTARTITIVDEEEEEEDEEEEEEEEEAARRAI